MIDFFQTLGIKTFVLADCENAETSNPELLADFLQKNKYLNLRVQVICFIGADSNQNRFYDRFTKYVQQKEIACNISSVRIDITADDALDKVIIAYLGMLMAQKPDAQFVVISADTGYEIVIKHFAELRIAIKRESVPKPEKAIAKKKANPKKSPEKKVVSDSTEAKAKSSTNTKAKKTKTNGVRVKFERIANEIVDDLEKLQTPKPKTSQTIKKRIKNKDSNLDDKAINEISSLVLDKLKSAGKITINNKKVEWNEK